MIMKNKERIEEALYYMQNDTAKAIKIFDEILDKDPENIRAINGKGFSLMKMDQTNEAEKIFDYSLSIKETPAALINKGIINKNNGNYDESLFYYDRAIEIKPSLTSIIMNLKNEIFEIIDEPESTISE